MNFRISRVIGKGILLLPLLCLSFSTRATFPVSSSSSEVTRRTGFLFHAASYTPVGLMFVTESKNAGMYIAVRLNPSIFHQSSSYEITDGRINDSYWAFNYTGESEYRRASFTLGMNYRILGDLGKISLHGYGGLGYGIASYFYKYAINSDVGSFGNKWVKDSDRSRKGLELEGGVLVNIRGINLSLGATVLQFSEAMITGGIGCAF